MDFFINCFDNLITNEHDLSFGSLSLLDIHTSALASSKFCVWQGDSGPLGCLPAPKTTTATTLTNTTTTTMTTMMTTITGRQKQSQQRAVGQTVTWYWVIETITGESRQSDCYLELRVRNDHRRELRGLLLPGTV